MAQSALRMALSAGRKREVGAGGVDWGVEVDEPGEEEDGDGADADDGGDDRGRGAVVRVWCGGSGMAFLVNLVVQGCWGDQKSRRPLALSIMASRSRGR